MWTYRDAAMMARANQSRSMRDILPHGWIPQLPVNHGALPLDGLEIARDAVAAWREEFEAWGLI